MTGPVRYRLDISYDGTAFSGWQVQPKCRTVQGIIEETLKILSGQCIKVHGSGRTDQGVHARQQVAHFDWDPGRFMPVTLAKALNARLPDEVRIMSARRVADTFHARKSVKNKEYRYFIWNGPVLPPYQRLTHVHIHRPLNVDAMKAAAEHLKGSHDFSSFSANPKRVVETHVRDLMQLSIKKTGHEIEIIAKSNGFLYKMVRSLVGHLLRVGQGEVDPVETLNILEAKQRTAVVETAPPQGLFLWKVTY